MLTHRTQILLDDERRDLLRREAARTGRSVGDLIREAIDRAFADLEQLEQEVRQAREEALQGFLGAPSVPVGSPSELEAELDTILDRTE